jgi:hypothetical protein
MSGAFSVYELVHPGIQSPAFLNVDFVLLEKSVSANLVLRTVAVANALRLSLLIFRFALLKV